MRTFSSRTFKQRTFKQRTFAGIITQIGTEITTRLVLIGTSLKKIILRGTG